MRLILILHVLLVMALNTALAQTPSAQSDGQPCKLTLSQAPEFRGVKLGMTVEEVLRFFPPEDAGKMRLLVEEAKNPPRFGATSFNIPLHSDQFKGLNQIYVQTFDGRVVDLQIFYLSGPNYPDWVNIDEFIEKIAAKFSLPKSQAWIEKYHRTKQLDCVDFTIEAESRSNPGGTIRFTSKEQVKEEIKRRREALEAKKRAAFMP